MQLLAGGIHQADRLAYALHELFFKVAPSSVSIEHLQLRSQNGLDTSHGAVDRSQSFNLRLDVESAGQAGGWEGGDSESFKHLDESWFCSFFGFLVVGFSH